MGVSKPIVAIIGRQNVGKSTLLNRLAGRRVAIVEDMPGTTRDRIFADVAWGGASFTLVDTGGLEVNPRTAIARGIKVQVEAAIAEADVIIFMVNVRDGVVPADLEIAEMLRSSPRPVVLVANKADSPKMESGAAEFYQMGLEDLFITSAYHGRGTAELLDKIISLLPAPEPAEPEPEAEMLKLAIVGRPNVGKSTLLNALLGEERSIVDDAPGTTHDAVDTLLDFNGQSVLLIDTAGIRRRGRWGVGVERYGIIRALRAIDRADVVLLVLDATEMVTAQDKHIAGYVQEAVKGVVLVVNKWDLLENKEIAEYNRHIRSQLRFVSHAPIVYTSAMLGQEVDRVVPEAFEVYQERHKRLPTTVVNSVVQEAVAAHHPPRKSGRQLKILYATQAEVNPPTFVFFVNDARLISASYRNYLENKLRKAQGFNGTPLRFIFKNRSKQLS
jgi:GTP-binding protein